MIAKTKASMVVPEILKKSNNDPLAPEITKLLNENGLRKRSIIHNISAYSTAINPESLREFR
ncbi:MAG: hypothetical protein NDI94_00400 [Candidatus Woesearchaeota archaeon]|nr:hypothetical protein [Candidatus Woesearchaeota archaeon]